MSELYGFEIVIPFHGQYLNVRNCIESILVCTVDCPYRIFLVDDASKNDSFLGEMKKLSNVVEGIRLKEQRGFGAAMNAAVQATKLPFLVFLHSDVKIVDGKWLMELYKSFCRMRKSDRVEMVCATSSNPPNQCESLLRQRREKKGDTVATEPLPIFGALCARSLFHTVGGFREYKYGWYEDEEWFWRLKRWGYNEGVSGMSYIEHEGGKTVDSLWKTNPETKVIMTETNRDLCLNDVRKLWGK